MPISQEDALRIHAAIHEAKVSVTLTTGTTLKVSTGKLRGVEGGDINAKEQNKSKPSKWAAMAKGGAKITWFLGGSPAQWGRVVDGVVDQCGKHIEEGSAKAKGSTKAKGKAATAKSADTTAVTAAVKAKAKAKANCKKVSAPVPAAPPTKKAKTEASSLSCAPTSSGDDPLALSALFAGKGYGAVWQPLLRPVLEKLPNAATYIGPARSNRMVPVRELTFQALKPNPPAGWRVISLGQSPYPRVESATGIAHFDGGIDTWESGRFGAVVTMRCIIKAAAMHKHGVPKSTSTAELRTLLKDKLAVGPAEWFQAMLSQGVLFMNAACTLLPPEDKSVRAGSVAEEHTVFWRPVLEAIIDAILAACQKEGRGLVFAWWGSESLKSKKVLDKSVFKRFPDVRMEHIEWKNPAAMADAFCDSPNIFGRINDALNKLNLGKPVDWLPEKGWETRLGGKELAGEMGDFITETKELHKMYLERLRDGLGDRLDELADITGIADRPLLSLEDCCKDLDLAGAAASSMKKACKMSKGSLTDAEAAAIHLYTTNHLYKQLNAALRSATRDSIKKYFSYLRLLLSGLAKLPSCDKPLYRGVSLDLSDQYKLHSEVTWWAMSSCTPDLKVASSFSGGFKGKSTLFVIQSLRSVAIKEFSEYKAEEEFVLAPGTQFMVDKVIKTGPKVEVHLRETNRPRRVR